MLYVKPKVRLSRAGDNAYSLKLSCDCARSFVSQAIVKGLTEGWIKENMSAKPLTPRLGIWEGV